MNATQKANSYPFRYHSCRNISSPEDEVAGRRVYSGHAPASSVLELEDNENVREYLVDAKGKQRRSPTLVHQAIRKTLMDQPDQFSILNGGMVVVARSATVDDKERTLHLARPSIINGSQTQGELRRYFEKHGNHPDHIPSIKFEVIVTDDDALIAEISIARNFQNDVRAISIAGRRGQLDDLEVAIQKGFPSAKLRKAETDLTSDGDFLDTEKIIQVIFALMPEHLLRKLDVAEPSAKVFTYSQKTRCLKLYQRVVEENELADVYDYCLDLAPVAWKLYERWKAHQGFKGTRIRSIEREDGRIADVPDGVIFPILAAHTAFVRQDDAGTWGLHPPNAFSDAELIESAKQAYMEIADHNPWNMGKSRACYSTLLQITSIYAKLGTSL
ncbi:MAG: AIPR family protein [Phenylobacterium sp.]|uniref:AIPR family protein n=1 Tax=Phenylobacterium sp. TaxID=1871053 RepID=UPI0025EF97DB|nr:AIPR family protein [Phenylobacterium sp.]MCA6227593.1 AIPR family protein [Phenylobacterium sp.]MCA6230877.1 AIPR family protein [Phenylobacterium sp.]MCA6250466.1 AIPR family protein [Phenylobacterium sp.]MCA6250954.1 AIPR family protein [Phenylobacterium sp.]MCA6257637.1 AIPR family protein [Phenylobacterium sp.]